MASISGQVMANLGFSFSHLHMSQSHVAIGGQIRPGDVSSFDSPSLQPQQANVRASGTGIRVAHTRPTALDMSLLGALPPNPWLIIRVGLSVVFKCPSIIK
jgi:hypothetical protein